MENLHPCVQSETLSYDNFDIHKENSKKKSFELQNYTTWQEYVVHFKITSLVQIGTNCRVSLMSIAVSAFYQRFQLPDASPARVVIHLIMTQLITLLSKRRQTVSSRESSCNQALPHYIVDTPFVRTNIVELHLYLLSNLIPNSCRSKVHARSISLFYSCCCGSLINFLRFNTNAAASYERV